MVEMEVLENFCLQDGREGVSKNAVERESGAGRLSPVRRLLSSHEAV